MGIFWSTARCGFFDDTLHHTLPDDAFEIDAELHASLLEAQSNGEIIQGSELGDVISAPPNFERATFLEHIRRLRKAALIDSDWTQLTDAPVTAAKAKAWAAYRLKLRDLPDLVSKQLDHGVDAKTIKLPKKPG